MVLAAIDLGSFGSDGAGVRAGGDWHNDDEHLDDLCANEWGFVWPIECLDLMSSRQCRCNDPPLVCDF